MLNTGCSPVFASFLVVQYPSGYSRSYLMLFCCLFSVLWSRQKKPPLPLADGLKNIAVSSERCLNCRHKNALTLRDFPLLYPSHVFLWDTWDTCQKVALTHCYCMVFAVPIGVGHMPFWLGHVGHFVPLLGVPSQSLGQPISCERKRKLYLSGVLGRFKVLGCGSECLRRSPKSGPRRRRDSVPASDRACRGPVRLSECSIIGSSAGASSSRSVKPATKRRRRQGRAVPGGDRRQVGQCERETAYRLPIGCAVARSGSRGARSPAVRPGLRSLDR